ncbi:MAG: molybdopterin-binding protein [Gemmatimonadales bacterium]
MKRILLPLGLAALCCTAAGAQQAPDSGPRLEVRVDSVTVYLTAEDIAGLPRDTVTARIHDGPPMTWSGPLVSTVLERAGASFARLKGAALARYLLVVARDGYRTVYAAGELDRDLTGRRVILADRVNGAPLADADGPWRIISEGDARPARWSRQVSALYLLEAEP